MNYVTLIFVIKYTGRYLNHDQTNNESQQNLYLKFYDQAANTMWMDLKLIIL